MSDNGPAKNPKARNRSKDGRSKWRRFGLPLSIIFGCLAMLIWPICSMLYRVEDRVFLLHCQINLENAFYAIQAYANAHDGYFPADWKDLFSGQTHLTPQALVCAGRYRDDAGRSNPEQLVNELDGPDGKHFSFYYFGRGLQDKSVAADEVIALERLGNHYDFAVAVLLGNRKTEVLWCKPGTADASTYNRLLVDYAAGVRPLRLRP